MALEHDTIVEDVSSSDENINSIEKFINKKKKVKVVYVKRITTTKTTKELNHEVVDYNGSKYVVCCIPHKETHKLFVIDYDNHKDIISKTWHVSSNNYIQSADYTEDNKRKYLYLHRFVMNDLIIEDNNSIDHINRIGTDNRKANLRNVSQTLQNYNQNKRKRNIVLPENCGINIEDIPKNIYYSKPSGSHGEYFSVEIVGVPTVGNGDFYWKTTKSKIVDLKTKLQQAINKLLELQKEYPELTGIIKSEKDDEIRKKLIDEYNEIIMLSHYPKNIKNENTFKFESECIKHIDENIKESIKTIRKNIPPSDSGVDIDKIPKYCYFKPESDKRGCKFVIDRHPKLVEQNIKSWSTTESKKVSIQDKYNSLIKKLQELDNTVSI